MRPRGLKHDDRAYTVQRIGVAAHAAAWIETCRKVCAEPMREVAAHAAAWIETRVVWICEGEWESRPMRPRGLKLAGDMGF